MGVKNSSGVVTAASVINYSGLDNLEIFLGSGGDTLNVTGVMKRDDAHRTITVVNTGAGNDAVTVSLAAAGNGFFVLNTEAGDDHIDASASTLGVTIFGGLGSDTITGGHGADTIFGDKGQIDYRDGSGKVVTRLGLGLAERVVLKPGDAAVGSTDLPFFQTDGVNRQAEIITTRATGTGSVDTITGGDGDNIILGGLGADTITTGTGTDLILGDNGSIQYDTAGVLNRLQTISPELGAGDTIHTGAGTKHIIGGYGKDEITANAGDHVIIGDAGQIDYDTDGAVRKVDTTDTVDHPEYGDMDTIVTGNGNSLVLGGMGVDTITTATGTDVILGDNGTVTYTGTTGSLKLSQALTKLSSEGAGDTIHTGAGTKHIIGGYGADAITAGTGNHVIIGDAGQVDYDTDGAVKVLATTDTEANSAYGDADTITIT
ncbi:MAG: hypothetical protein CVT71_01460, partial [Alphaproteobacteria bacterium HGW-Alphaproteobacteria-10]